MKIFKLNIPSVVHRRTLAHSSYLAWALRNHVVIGVPEQDFDAKEIRIEFLRDADIQLFKTKWLSR